MLKTAIIVSIVTFSVAFLSVSFHKEVGRIALWLVEFSIAYWFLSMARKNLQ